MPSMQAMPVYFSTLKPLTESPNPSLPPDRMSVIVGSALFVFMGILFHILSDPESPKHLGVWIRNTSLGRTVGWLWARFWGWGTLSWVIAGIAIPVGIAAAAMGMYLIGRCLVALGIMLLIAKLIHDAVIEKRSTSEVAWIAGISGAIGLALVYGCFWAISAIEWKHEMVIRMTFKQSPVLADQQDRIQWEMNSFFLYLKKVGFNLPAEIPPLGLNPPHSVMLVGGPTIGPISTHSIFIPEDAIQNTDNIRFAYSVYTFNRLLAWPDMLKSGMTPAEKGNDEVAAWIAECYFPASFVGHVVCDGGTPGYKWQEALWEVREKLGQDYADGLICYTVNLWASVPSKYVDDFDKFFRYKLVSGESVKDSPNTGREIDAIFKRHGL
jgi:hypothetical protein